MTVQKLIDELNKIEDKSLLVYYYNYSENYEEINDIQEDNSDIILW